ncbi:MAG: cysteine--tRNA ligase [Bradymonadales bacterium]|nr:MAG: cysteine--tRNA ligase [Bradymonadales bacterium]
MEKFFLFNTLSRSKEEFKALKPPQVRLYTCGPTVYHYAHIGNLRTFLFEDLLVRSLHLAGYEVFHVMNITDVGHLVSDADEGEDKMEKGAAREGKSAREIANYYTQSFLDDFQKLGCRMPDRLPKATDHIQEMIELIQSLEKRGFVYRTTDGLYFDTQKFPRYADFARLDVENLEAGMRVGMGEKRAVTDFALWKFSPPKKKRQMEWESPWGKGFPGWHIECSAMAIKYLGESFDIHCGGKDHIPVHHTNEIAQSECATEKIFARYWLHAEFLTESSGKMSKSKEDFLRLKLLEDKGYRPRAFRFLCLQAHYRTELHFDWTSLDAAEAGYTGLLNRLRDWTRSVGQAGSRQGGLGSSEFVTQNQERMKQALFDDLNSPRALGLLFEALKDPQASVEEKTSLLLWSDDFFALGLQEVLSQESSETLGDEVQKLVQEREKARAEKRWADSDRIRAELLKMGYRVEDTPQGSQVLKVS